MTRVARPASFSAVSSVNSVLSLLYQAVFTVPSQVSAVGAAAPQFTHTPSV